MPTHSSRTAALERAVAYHRDRYYHEDAPELSDAEYDALIRQLQTDAPDSALLQTVGGPASLPSEKVPHRRPLLSLANAVTADEVRQFLQKLPASSPLYLEYKIDGLTVVLTYTHGVLTQAATRGNGLIGENVLANVQTIADIPQQLPDSAPDSLTIRGEVFLPWSEFHRLNALGDRAWANPRNAAAGALRTKDPTITQSRHLSCWVYDIVDASDGLARSQAHMMADLIAWGFAVEPHGQLCPAESVVAQATALYDARTTLDFAIDGIVVKANDPAIRAQLGHTSTDPRWAIAYKFPGERGSTTLAAVTWQVGRTGRLTPVGLLAPVSVAGSVITRVTLHNSHIVEAWDLHLGDTVIIEKAGEVIPALVGVVSEHRAPDAPPVTIPTTCPECGAALVEDRCTGTACPAQQFSALYHFVRPDAMNIEGLGPILINQLIDGGRLTTIADYFDLTPADLIHLPGVGARTADTLVARIHAAKSRGMEAFLIGLGIPLANHGTAKRLAVHYPSLEALLAVVDGPDALAQLQAIEDIGPKVADSLVTTLRSPTLRTVIARCQAAGVSLVSPRWHAEPTAAGPLAQTVWVLTGTLSVSRATMETLLHTAGATISGSVSARTDYVLIGEHPGSKAQKATTLGIPLIDEPTVRAWIATGQQP